jgi:hypothetical protein
VTEREWLTDRKLVLSGDFFQLPPVDLGSKHVQFAFQAPSWDQCIDSVTSLTRVFRQKEQCERFPLSSDGRQNLPANPAFVELLNEMRFGKLSKQNKSRLTALSREVRYTDSVEPTELYVPGTSHGGDVLICCFRRFPTKREVQFSNESRLAKLTGPMHTFNAIDHPGIDDKGRDVPFQQAKVQLDRCVLAPESMTLKVRNTSALDIPLKGLILPTLGWCTGDVDQGTEGDPMCSTRSYTRIECRTGNIGQWLGGKSY